MSGLVKQASSTIGTAVDPSGPSGVLIDPDEITQPGGPASAGDVLTADGLGGAAWLPPANSNFAVQLYHDQGVPGGGTRFLRYGDNIITSVAGFRLPANGTLVGLTWQNDVSSGNDYALEILRDPAGRLGTPVVIATLNLSSGSLFSIDRTFSAAITAATDELGARIVRTSGAGAGLGFIAVLAEFIVS